MAAPKRVICQQRLSLFFVPAVLLPPSSSCPPLHALLVPLVPLTLPPVSLTLPLCPLHTPACPPPLTHTEETKKALSAEYIADQKAVDAALLKALTPELKGYLGTRFTLHDGDRPHLMKF